MTKLMQPRKGRVYHRLRSLAHNIHHKAAPSRFIIASEQSKRVQECWRFCGARETALLAVLSASRHRGGGLNYSFPWSLHLLLLPYQRSVYACLSLSLFVSH